MKQPAGRMPGKILPVSPVIVLVALALAVAATGSVTLPLDGHEVLVVGTTQEMQQRGDWVVPYFNGEPRLTKPPLSYWLTGVTAWLSGSLDSIQAWHARVPSILAGVGLVLLTWLTGTRLFGAATGITAGLLLLSSVAFFSYSHDGRPDMVYALCCMGGLTCFVFAQTTVSPPSGGWIYLMWLSYGLATLAKGPQLPLCMLFACLLYLRFSGCGWRQGAAQLRIFAGSALAVAIVLPWWRLLRNSVPSAALDMSQLSGTLLIPRWQDAFDLYYFYQPLILILPWLALLPATLARLWRRLPNRGAELLLVLLLLIPAVVLSFGTQKRWFYMLPLAPTMCLLLALGVRSLLAHCQLRPTLWRRCFWPAHMGLAVLTVVGLLIARAVSAVSWTVVGVLLLMSLAIARAHFQGPLTRQWRRGLLAAWSSCIMMAVIAVALAATELPWSVDRYNKVQLATIAKRQLKSTTPVFAWYINPSIYVHYLGRRVPRISGLGEVRAVLRDGAITEVGLLLPGSLLSQVWGWPGLGYPQPVGSIAHGESDTTMLVLIHNTATDRDIIKK